MKTGIMQKGDFDSREPRTFHTLLICASWLTALGMVLHFLSPIRDRAANPFDSKVVSDTLKTHLKGSR